MTDERKWCWCEVDSEHANGPFDTREEALADAMTALDEVLDTVEVGRCHMLKAVEWAEVFAPEDILERMTDMAADNVSLPDDEVFYICKDKMEAAREALSTALKTWVEAYVEEARWFEMQDKEVVRLR